MKLDNNSNSPSFHDMAEMLSKMKTLLIDVLLEKNLPDGSRMKLKDCISMVESFSNFLKSIKKEEQNSDNFLKPLHAGLSKSSECLNVKKNHMSKSRSTSDLADYDVYDNDNNGEFDLNNLKESYLQAVNELNRNNSEINDEVNSAEVGNAKPEINSDKTETNEANPDVNDVLNRNNEGNDAKPQMNDAKSIVNGSDPEVNGTKLEVVRREEKSSKPRRKRDSSTLFDISLDDLTEPDHSGFLVEKHSGKEWWCVLQDQHLCMFPSQNPQELAYDVLLVPCCEISLDDVYTESPVFRLTQVGSTPWVFSAGIERNLRAWIRALHRACGRDDADWSMRSSKKGRGRKSKNQKRNMKVLTSTIAESEEVEEVEEVNGAMVDALENKITAEKEPGNQEDVKRSDGIQVLEEHSKDEMKEDIKEAVEHTNGSKIDEGKERNGDKNSEERKKEVEHEDQVEKLKGGKDETNPKDNKETNRNRSEKPQSSNKVHQTVSEEDPTAKEENELLKNQKELPNASPGEPDSILSEKNDGGGNDDMEQDQDGVFKNINESKSPQLKDDKQENNSENGNNTCLPKIAFDDDHSDYVIRVDSADRIMGESQTEEFETPKRLNMERKATKKRIKMLRWLKKAIVDKGQDDVTVIGDIYRVDGAYNHVKLWCLLRDRQLYCYSRVTDTTPESVMPLDNCIAVASDCNFGKKYAFHVEKDGMRLATFAARTSKERTRWMEIVKTKRGRYPLAELGRESEEDSTGSGTSEEEDDDSHEYVEVNQNEFKGTEPTYALPMCDVEDVGYVSILALECEIDRRRSCKKEKKYNPNITNKCGIEHLAEKDTPSFLSAKPKDVTTILKRRLPAPLPKDATLLSAGKTQGDVSKAEPSNVLENSEEREPGDGMDLNNNRDVDILAKESCTEYANDEELLSHACKENGILHCQLSASSWLPDSPPSQARFGLRPNGSEDATGAWRPAKNDKTQFLEIDLGDILTVDAIAIKGRPDFDEKGGEFVKSFTMHYSTDKETWTPYKSHGKIKVFQGISSATQECKKYLKNKTSAQYFRIYPQSWQNHIALRVALYKEDVKPKGLKKKGDKSGPTSPVGKMQLTKEDISDPMHPSSDCLITEVTSIKENGMKHLNANAVETLLDCSDNPASMESRINLREKLLSKEKREQITKLSVLKQHVDQAKDRMIVVNTSGQLKREAIESEHDYLVANLELVKAKKRLIDIETEMRELRLFGEKYSGEQQQEPQEAESPEEIEKPEEAAKTTEVRSSTEAPIPAKRPLKRRPSKEVMICTDVVSPMVDREGFNSPGDPPPPRKVMDNVKLFEKLQLHP